MSQDQNQIVISSENNRILRELLNIVKDSISILEQKQKNFVRIVAQEIYWILQEWIDFLFKQNLTHIHLKEEAYVKQLLSEFKAKFETILICIKNLNLSVESTYESNLLHFREIARTLRDLTNQMANYIESITQQFLTNQEREKIEDALCLNYSDADLKNYDMLFEQVKRGENPKKPISKTKLLTSDIACIMIPLEKTDNVQIFEISDIFEFFKEVCKNKGINLLESIHLKKLELCFGDISKGQIFCDDLNDFFNFIWCNQLERKKLLNNEPAPDDALQKNKLQLQLKLLQKSPNNQEMNQGQTIIINEKGLVNNEQNMGNNNNNNNGDFNGRAKSQSVRFGRKAQASIFHCDVLFDAKEKSISKRQFVIKPDVNCYYAYCVSPSNPTEFLVQQQGAFVTTGSQIILADKIALLVSECVVQGDDTLGQQTLIHQENKSDDENEGPTIRRGQKKNPLIEKYLIKKKNNKAIEDIPIVRDNNGDSDEDTDSTDQKTFERTKNGMKRVEKLLGRDFIKTNEASKRVLIERRQIDKESNNNGDKEDDDDDDDQINPTQQFKQQENKIKRDQSSTNAISVQATKSTTDGAIPNQSLGQEKDVWNNYKHYINLKLEWTESSSMQDEDLENAFNNLNRRLQCNNQDTVTIGSDKGCDIVIPELKKLHCAFKYYHQINRWMIHDEAHTLKDLQTKQITTIAFKPQSDAQSHSQLYALQEDTIIVVQLNFFKVLFTPNQS